jgi:DNA-binding NarL/FixJ family response regulator
MERGKKPRGHGAAGSAMPQVAVLEPLDDNPISQSLTKDELEVMLAVTRGLSPRDIAKQTGREIKDIMHLLRDMCDRLELAGDVVWLVSAVSYRLGLEHGRSGY